MNSETRVAVFAYNFPHRKTQEFLHRLFVEGITVSIVLAADPVPLKIPPSAIRLKPRYGGLVHPRTIAKAYQWPYEIVDHGSGSCAEFLRNHGTTIGLISGARILTGEVIRAVPGGIINFHPAILPQGRGLDALQWSIVENRPIGVTAHFINEKVDAGRMITKRELNLCPDESLMELSMRLQDTQTEMIPEVFDAIRQGADFPELGPAPLHRKMPADLEKQVPELYSKRLERLRSAAASAPLFSKNADSSGRSDLRT